MPKIELHNHHTFASVKDMVNSVINIIQSAQSERARQLCPHATVILGNYKDEEQFCSMLYDCRRYEFVELYSSEVEIIPRNNVKQMQISSKNMEQVIDYLAWYPAQGGTPLVLRRPPDTITALYVAAFAGCRNFVLITTLIDKARANQIFYLNQCVR